MKLINTDKAEGTRVSGNYLGMFPFTGVVSMVRCAPVGYLYEVALDSSIEVFGLTTDSVRFYSGSEDASTVEVL